MQRTGFTQMSFQIRNEIAKEFKDACVGVGTSATTMILVFMALLASKAKAGRLRIPIRLADDSDIPMKNLQIVLDRADNAEEIRDLVHTVLGSSLPLTWTSQIGPGADWTEELKAAVNARLAELRRDDSTVKTKKVVQRLEECPARGCASNVKARTASKSSALAATRERSA